MNGQKVSLRNDFPDGTKFVILLSEDVSVYTGYESQGYAPPREQYWSLYVYSNREVWEQDIRYLESRSVRGHDVKSYLALGVDKIAKIKSVIEVSVT